MEVLGIRYCSVSSTARELAAFLTALGAAERKMAQDAGAGEGFSGAIFPAGTSWVEVWQEGPDMPAGSMLQLVVDDADAFAAHARSNGLSPQGPIDAHGERIYYIEAPGGLQMSFQSVPEKD